MIQGVLRLLTPGFSQSAAPSILLTKVLPTYVLRTASASTSNCFVWCPHLHLALCKKYVAVIKVFRLKGNSVYRLV
jgi:hypothetical protein